MVRPHTEGLAPWVPQRAEGITVHYGKPQPTEAPSRHDSCWGTQAEVDQMAEETS